MGVPLEIGSGVKLLHYQFHKAFDSEPLNWLWTNDTAVYGVPNTTQFPMVPDHQYSTAGNNSTVAPRRYLDNGVVIHTWLVLVECRQLWVGR